MSLQTHKSLGFYIQFPVNQVQFRKMTLIWLTGL